MDNISKSIFALFTPEGELVKVGMDLDTTTNYMRKSMSIPLWNSIFDSTTGLDRKEIFEKAGWKIVEGYFTKENTEVPEEGKEDLGYSSNKLDIEKRLLEEFMKRWFSGDFPYLRLGQAFYNFMDLHKMKDQNKFTKLYQSNSWKDIHSLFNFV